MTSLPRLADLAAEWPELSGLLDELLDLPSADRPARLAADATLSPERRGLIEQLLGSGAGIETGDFMRTLPPLRLLPQPEDEPGPDSTLGPWRLIEPVGEGGMGTVWRAERADGSLARPVALKLPRLVWGGAVAARMARERDILGRLEHDHIARLYDAGADALGRPWLALEFVDGRPITDWCEARKLDVPGRLALLLQVCEALQFAHGRLVIHRDLKPANILVTEAGTVKLLDFGIAQLIQGDGAAEATQFSARAMTPDYASPEQLRGEPLSTASDVYSLGVVAYELLAGARPYEARREGRGALDGAAELDDAPLASRRTANPGLARTLRGGLDAVLARALQGLPVDRYASVDAMAQDIRRYLAHEPVLAQPPSPAYRALKFLRRHRVPVLAGSVALAALLAGTAVSLGQATAARQAEALALDQQQRAEDATAKALAREREARQAEAATRAERERAVLAEAQARAAAEQAQADRGRAERAAEAERRAAAEARGKGRQAQREADRARLIGNVMLNTLGRVAADPVIRQQGGRERVAVMLEQELNAIDLYIAQTPSAVAEVYGASAAVFNYLQQPERQLAAARREMELLQLAGEKPLRIAESSRQLALALSRNSDLAGAIDVARAGLAVLADDSRLEVRIQRSRLHRAVGRYARLLGQAGWAYAASTASVQALEGVADEALDTGRHYFGAALADHAVNSLAIERDGEALALLDRADRLYAGRQMREADRADIELARCMVLISLGRHDPAATACAQAGALYAPQFGAVGRNADIVDSWRVLALIRGGRLDEAGVSLERVRSGGTGTVVWLHSAEWALARGDSIRAEEWLERQAADVSNLRPARRALWLRLRSALRLAQGRPDEAAAEARQAIELLEHGMPGERRELRLAWLDLAAAESAAGRDAGWWVGRACGATDPPPPASAAAQRCARLSGSEQPGASEPAAASAAHAR